MSQQQIANVVRHFGISPEWNVEFFRLVNFGRVKTCGFGRLTRQPGRFRDALDVMLDVLSAPYAYHFGNERIQECAEALAIAGD